MTTPQDPEVKPLQATATSPAGDVSPAPRGVIAPLVEILQTPELVVARSRQQAQPKPAILLFMGSLICAAAYGASSGFFQGGSQILLSMVKAPLILAGSVVLCAPSLFVFSSLAGSKLSGARFLTVLAGFSALLGLLLLGFLPISWLFSVSSKSMLFVVWLHIGAWVIALTFAGRFVARALNDATRRGGLMLWLLLFFAVSLQVATVFRPVLWRAPESPFFEAGKKFFTEHLDSAADFDRPQQKPSAPP